jgi:hypothetical protein
MPDSFHLPDDFWTESEISSDSEIEQAIHLSTHPMNARWLRLATSLWWLERNPILFLILLGTSWACGQLCEYFGFTILLGGFFWIYYADGFQVEG